AIDRAGKRLSMRIGKPIARRWHNDSAATLRISVSAAGPVIPDIGMDESYTLSVDDQHAVLTAPTVIGALRGLETVLQLQQADAGGFYLQGTRIRDVPRFRWRGLNLDVSRHFDPVEMFDRTLDGRAPVKLNVCTG